GGRELMAHVCKTFGVQPGAVSANGKITVTAVECLGSCGTAPMMQVNDTFVEDLTPELAVKKLKEMGA
ncbi:MAG: NAD(P)H-dependent oxidoreductase subunit E, partial [Bdellovibrionales bacterium]